jgi:hypothetical protein
MPRRARIKARINLTEQHLQTGRDDIRDAYTGGSEDFVFARPDWERFWRLRHQRDQREFID